MELMYNEELEEWVEKPKSYATIEIGTEEDYKILRDAIDLRMKLKELGKYDLEGDVRDFLAWMQTVNHLIEQYTAVPSKRKSEEENNG